MRISGWGCVVGEGGTRAVTHPENGNAVLLKNGRLMGSCDLPPEVFRWLMLEQLRNQWDFGFVARSLSESDLNPWAGEPVDKGKEPS